MIRVSPYFLLFTLIIAIFLYEGVETKRGGSSGSRGSSGGRSSSRGSSGSRSSSSGGSSWGSSSSRSRSSSSSSSHYSGGSRSYGSSSGGSYDSSGGSYSRPPPNYGSSGRSWGSRYSGNNYVVLQTHTYYGGGGYGRVYSSNSGSLASAPSATAQPSVSESPTISTAMIRDALFPGSPRRPSKEIFDYEDNYLRQRYDQEGNVDHMDQMTQLRKNIGEFMKADLQTIGKHFLDGQGGAEEELTIRDEEAPVVVNSIPYFWGDENLPQSEDDAECFDFTGSNSPSNYTICNVTSLVRCHDSLAEVFVIGKKPEFRMSTKTVDDKVVVKNANGTIADRFAWFCPPSDQCCEWECCSSVEKEHTYIDPPDDQFVFLVHSLIIIGIFALITTIVCLCKWRSRRNREQAFRAQRQGHQEPANPIEMRPLTSDYPRQAQRPQGAGQSSSSRARFVPIHERLPEPAASQAMSQPPPYPGNDSSIGWKSGAPAVAKPTAPVLEDD